MEASMSLDVATTQLASDIKQAGDRLLEVAGEQPDRWWHAYELKDRARNGWSAGAMDIALNRLIDTGKFDVRGDKIHIRIQ
jgi:hypothetical protein